MNADRSNTRTLSVKQSTSSIRYCNLCGRYEEVGDSSDYFLLRHSINGFQTTETSICRECAQDLISSLQGALAKTIEPKGICLRTDVHDKSKFTVNNGKFVIGYGHKQNGNLYVRFSPEVTERFSSEAEIIDRAVEIVRGT